MAWYEGFFEDEAWQRVQRTLHGPEVSARQAEQLIALLGLQPGDEVLDVPCGTGRISLELAARGLAVTGVDRTPALLADASAGAAARGLSLALREGDMRDLPWEGRFYAVLNLWGSFGYFDDAGNAAFAAAARRALRPGGAFVLDIPSLETLAPRYQSKVWFTLGDMTVLEDRRYDHASGFMDVTWSFLRGDRRSERPSRVRIYSAPELSRLLREAGFAEVTFYGGMDGSPFGFDRRMLAVARA